MQVHRFAETYRRRFLKAGLSSLLLLGLLFVPLSAYAISLEEAKQQGLVGEQPNGYLGLVESSAPADVKKLVEDINRQRQEKYHAIAQSRKTPVAAVEALAGKTAIEKSSSGHFIKVDGSWQKK